MTWAAPYIGTPHEHTLEANCLGFARRVQREVFGRELPGMLSVTRSALGTRDLDSRYPEIERPRDGCLVLMGTPAREAAHVGVWCAEARRVVHADDSFGSVIASDLMMLSHLWSSIRFFAVPA